ncbi:conserved exported hypothetical protein [Crenothrix polyspora]|uniref:Peptidase M12B domain-containing protein n=1 Tax=Crenothrix polyspora TaxID=360316 RepID=A0A1R4HBY4_9GAMM|nr:M12 family metallo-peptidase [Crenothrix polyspora]SJM93719.1 conserved exported hypothetical protein [Crenothrix polyspora]
MKYKPTGNAIGKCLLKSAIALLCMASATSGIVLAASTTNTLPQLTTTMQTVDASALLKRVSIGNKMTINNVELDGEEANFSLNLQRFEVFKTNAVITVHDAKGEQHIKPALSAYYRGSIEGKPESVAVLSADPSGAMRGIVQLKDKFWVLTGGQATGLSASGLSSVEIQQSGLSDNAEAFRCDVDKLPKTLQSSPARLKSNLPVKALQAGQYYQVPVAIETDAEFYSLFNSTDAATAYIGNLFAYASTIYKQEASAELLVGSISLWTNGTSSDPWNHTDTLQGLKDFQDYWKTNKSNEPRAIAHFLSGRDLGGGIAYLGALCDNSWSYGYSANLRGNFSLPNPKPVWDIKVVAHEIGHNFDSGHTHDYQNIGGDSHAVDACYNSNGATGVLPGINSLSGGTAGTGAGTIMSYCHQNSPGMANISLTFGKNHLFGIKAYRVSDVISSYVAQEAANNPSCITTPGTETFALNVNTTGNGSVISNPSGIDCGNDCSESYAKNTQITLTATPGSDSNFSGWGGGACTGIGSCIVTMDAAKSVTASFTLNPVVGTPLTITKAGDGTGKVTSAPTGIDCGSTCEAGYTANASVKLTATPDADSTFVGWTGDCKSTALTAFS